MSYLVTTIGDLGAAAPSAPVSPPSSPVDNAVGIARSVFATQRIGLAVGFVIGIVGAVAIMKYRKGGR